VNKPVRVIVLNADEQAALNKSAADVKGSIAKLTL